MATSPDSTDSTRRWVATLIVALLLAQAGLWAWRKIRPPEQSVAQAGLQHKIAASMAYDTALLRADSLLTAADTVAASRLLDSLSRQPTAGLFPIERQKLQQLQQRLSGGRPVSAAARRARSSGSPAE
ncbi:hypothetical protein [Hymenobacter psychrotolerans]|uniref:Uncharacterized protein n=1 Tax=Hymenobacter psychrotolerans DSM 18569 TaxID=1121959 RepID=A0A1M6YZ78_9BACT|nr:hypothetical protein [Hymenobacter psychrotolerans]SHL23425.1 hypothetical protein SAMN02746009_02371 [Hymenobacter psychrotolerans DSM 18569]